jgi:hypothetical protein
MNAVALTLALGLPFAAGAGLARCAGLAPGRGAFGLWAAWSWVLGALATAFVTWAWMATPLPKDTALVPAAALVAIGAIAFRRGRGAARLALDAPVHAGAAAWERTLLAVVATSLVALVVQRILAGDAVPIFQDDEANFWALKAKLIFRAGGLNDAFAASLSDPHYLYHRDYPLLNPLLQLWTFACHGEITHVANRLPIQMFALALVPALASALARVVRPAAAAVLLVVVLACASTASQSRTAHSDLMVALGALLAFDAWLRWRAGAGRGWFRLAAVGLALLVFAKGDGMVYLVAIALAWALARPVGPRIGAARAWLLLPLLVLALTWGVNRHFGFANDIATAETSDASFLALLVGKAPERVPRFASWFAQELLFKRAWAGFLPLFFAALGAVLARRLRRDDLGFAALALAATAAGFALILLATPHDKVSPTWHLETALPRISWQLVPALALWIGAACGRFLPGFRGAAPAAPTGPVR